MLVQKDTGEYSNNEVGRQVCLVSYVHLIYNVQWFIRTQQVLKYGSNTDSS